MTLTTRVELTGPITTDAAFDLALHALLRAADELHRLDGVATERDATLRGDRTSIGTVIGQGLPGITTAKGYDDNRQLRDPLPHDAEVAWDTVYGHHSRVWPTVEALHGAALVALHATLPEGVTMRWRNEYTGEWFDCLGGLDEFVGGTRIRALAIAWVERTATEVPK